MKQEAGSRKEEKDFFSSARFVGGLRFFWVVGCTFVWEGGDF